MAKLSGLKLNAAAVTDGEWRDVPSEFGAFRLRMRGYTDAYQDARNGQFRHAAKGLGGDTTKLPVAISRTITAKLIGSMLLLDVDGLENEDGSAVTRDQYAEAMLDPEYPDSLMAAIQVAAMIGTAHQDATADAVGNSAKPSITL